MDENIYSIFPEGEEFEEFNSILKENSLNKQVFFSINSEGQDIEEVVHKLDSIAEILRRDSEGYLQDIIVSRDNAQDQVIDYFYDHFPAVIDSNDYKEISKRLTPDSIKTSIYQVSDKMVSMNSLFLRKLLAKDPLGLAWGKLSEYNPKQDSNGLTLNEGVLFSQDNKRAHFTGSLNFDLSDAKKNEQFNNKLEHLKKKLNTEQPSISFDYFGTFQISYDNARQVKEDTFLTMIISVSLILLLLILYYRSLLTPIYFILPALFSGFAGLGIVGFIQPNISAISVATSAVLLGIVLDYSFHFFTHYKHSRSLEGTVKDVSFPMLVGSLSTILAFSALVFTDSVVLQNFGLIALSTLSVAVLFTLILLPPLLHFTKFKTRKVEKTRNFKGVPKLFLRISIFSILILTIVFLFKSNSFEFDSDMNNLSFHSSELVSKEEAYTGINPLHEKKIHLFVNAKTKSEALEENYKLYEQLDAIDTDIGLEKVVSVAPYSIPDKRTSEGLAIWTQYWNANRDDVLDNMNRASVEADFSKKAFLPFEKWIGVNADDFSLSNSDQLLDEIGLSKLIYQSKEGWNVITSVVVNREKLDDLKLQLNSNSDVFVFDIAEMANALMISVQDDFNYLFLFSSLLVLVSLLLVYGRVELALFAFLPMVISWIWILGIAGTFDITFNFVNIIVATFIFGLGDDFSIFVTDGLLQKYKLNSDALKSYKSAIILSGITTIIGTGVLYFTKHPAIHSIAIISVVGIGCIMLVTLTIQPFLFRFFVTNRIQKKRSPITLLGFVYSIFLFSYFFIGCTVLNLLLLLIIPFPIAKKKKRRFLNLLVSKLAKSTIYLGFHVKKHIRNKERLDFSNPSIIVANHSSFLDILLMIMINPKVIIMVKKWVYNSPVFGLFIRYSGYLFIAEGTDYNMGLIRERIADGYSIMIFPEGTRSIDGKMKRFHKGAFYLAQELKIDIQPILIIGADYVNPKNDIIIKSGSLILDVMERVKCTDEIFKERFGILAKHVSGVMREEMNAARSREYSTNLLKKRVMYNYLYKGPILEWYVRIKWMFEHKNFAFYDDIIGGRKRIYDVGCGYGYLGFYLHYRNPDREILGIDYDVEKIAVATNSYDKTDKLNFKNEDARNVDFVDADVLFFNDILHYVSLDEQLMILNKAVDQLNDNGIILIRDGVTDLGQRHAVTKRTEQYSTKISNFNKTTGDLSFFSSEDIFNFAVSRDLKCEMVEQSAKTSNVLFKLHKVV